MASSRRGQCFIKSRRKRMIISNETCNPFTWRRSIPGEVAILTAPFARSSARRPLAAMRLLVFDEAGHDPGIVLPTAMRLRLLASGAAQRAGAGRIVEEVDEAAGEGWPIARWIEQAGFAMPDAILDLADSGRDDRPPGVHVFEQLERREIEIRRL